MSVTDGNVVELMTEECHDVLLSLVVIIEGQKANDERVFLKSRNMSTKSSA